MCDVNSYPTYIGMKVIDDLDNHAVECGENEILWSKLPAKTRVITPDSFVTMDYDPTRLNLYVTEEYIVTKQKCG